MKKAALIVTSITHHATAQETLRVQDTVSALRRNGWSVDVLTPSSTPLLSATLGAEVRVFTVPRIPFLRHMLFPAYPSLTRRSTGLWSESAKPRSRVSMLSSSTFGDRMKPSIT